MRIGTEIKDQMKITALYTAFERLCEPEYYFKGETHNFWEIVILTDGCLGAAANGEVFSLKKGQAIIHAPMELHRVWVEGNEPAKFIIFTFESDHMPDCSAKVFQISNPDFPKEILNDIKNSFELYDISVLGIKDGFELPASVSIKKLELLILDTISTNVNASTRHKPKQAKSFEAVAKLLEANINKPLSVPEIARMSNMSESNLQKTVMRYTGMGVMHYFNRLKMTSAISMIQIGKSIKEVSETFGFADPNYFSTVFKRTIGSSPSSWKQNNADSYSDLST